MVSIDLIIRGNVNVKAKHLHNLYILKSHVTENYTITYLKRKSITRKENNEPDIKRDDIVSSNHNTLLSYLMQTLIILMIKLFTPTFQFHSHLHLTSIWNHNQHTSQVCDCYVSITHFMNNIMFC